MRVDSRKSALANAFDVTRSLPRKATFWRRARGTRRLLPRTDAQFGIRPQRGAIVIRKL